MGYLSVSNPESILKKIYGEYELKKDPTVGWFFSVDNKVADFTCYAESKERCVTMALAQASRHTGYDVLANSIENKLSKVSRNEKPEYQQYLRSVRTLEAFQDYLYAVCGADDSRYRRARAEVMLVIERENEQNTLKRYV